MAVDVSRQAEHSLGQLLGIPGVPDRQLNANRQAFGGLQRRFAARRSAALWAVHTIVQGQVLAAMNQGHIAQAEATHRNALFSQQRRQLGADVFLQLVTFVAKDFGHAVARECLAQQAAGGRFDHIAQRIGRQAFLG